jgi:hypothetical protein
MLASGLADEWLRSVITRPKTFQKMSSMFDRIMKGVSAPSKHSVVGELMLTLRCRTTHGIVEKRVELDAESVDVSRRRVTQGIQLTDTGCFSCRTCRCLSCRPSCSA